MNTVFMNSKQSGTLVPHRLLLNLTDKLNLKRNGKYSREMVAYQPLAFTHRLLLNLTDKSDKYVALSKLSIYYTWKNIIK